MTKQSIPNEVSIVSIPEDQTQNWGEITLSTSQSLMEELIRVSSSGSFVPYSRYNQYRDCIESHFTNDDYYLQPVNENIELLLSHHNDEIVGVNILNVKKVIPYQY